MFCDVNNSRINKFKETNFGPRLFLLWNMSHFLNINFVKLKSRLNIHSFIHSFICKKLKAYPFKEGSIAQKECNAFTSSIDAFAKIGQAICAILT